MMLTETIDATSFELRHAAVHEAGHVIAALQLGMPCHDVAIDQAGGGEFRSHEPTAWFTDPDNRTRFREVVLATLGPADRWGRMFDVATLTLVGNVATRRILGESWGGEHDNAQALAIARAINATAAEVNAWLCFAHGRAETIVEQNVTAIERVADALLLHGRLIEAEVRAIVEC